MEQRIYLSLPPTSLDVYSHEHAPPTLPGPPFAHNEHGRFRNINRMSIAYATLASA